MDIGNVALDQGPAEAPLPSVSDLPDGTFHDKCQYLFDADWQFVMRDNPEFASQAGFHEHDGLLQDLSPQAFEFRLEHNAQVKATIEKLKASATGSDEQSERDLLYLDLLADSVNTESRAIEAGCHLAPLNSIGIGGVHENFLELLEWMRFDTEDDVKVYINRLMEFPKQVQSYCDLLAYGGCMRGAPASKSMMRKVPDRLKELKESNLDQLREPLKDKELDPDVVENVNEAIKNCYKAGIARLQDFVSEFYLELARDDPGCKGVRDGDKIYAECLRYHTNTTKSAQEIHDMGLAEVARIEGRMQREVLDVLGFKGGSVAEFAATLKEDKANFWETEEALVEGYRALVAKITDMLPKYFKRLPTMKLEVVPWRTGPAAYYMAGTANGERPGRFYVNVSRLETRAKYEMPALALHEGIPGHHLQGALAIENTELPNFLRYLEDRRYEYNAARRAMYTGYLEGWALYCERLGEEMGMYSTPLELFGRLSCEMMRAVRLVVDTGIHAFGWSVERATKYMEEKTGMSTSECSEECHRYAAWPGQACGYKVGQLAIEEIRAKAELVLKSKFDLPSFHDQLLCHGPLPLDVLGRCVDKWIAQTLRASS